MTVDDSEAKKNEEAAVKIQAGYRGYVARKEVESMKNSKSDEDATKGKMMKNDIENQNHPFLEMNKSNCKLTSS